MIASIEFSWLFAWIISNTIVGLIIAAFAVAADRVWHRPALAHILWVLVLVKLLTPPIVRLPITVDTKHFSWLTTFSRVGPEQLPDAKDQRGLRSIADALGTTPTGDPTPWLRPLTVWGCLSVWSIGSIAIAAYLVLTTRRLRKLVAENGRVSPVAYRMFASMDVVPLERAPQVWLVRAVVSPMLVGVGQHARIIFPLDLWSRLDDCSRKMLLLHEMAHWRRSDGIVRYIEAVAWVLLWWHPLVWISRGRIEDCEERCCDLMVARSGSAVPRKYAEAILTTLDYLSEPSHWQRQLAARPIASPIGAIPHLEHRLREIMSADQRVAMGLAGHALVILMLLTLPLHPSLEIKRGVDSPGTTTAADLIEI